MGARLKEYALRILILQTVVSQGKQNICARICPHAYAPQRFCYDIEFFTEISRSLVRVRRIRPNENEISHSRVSWQTGWTYFVVGTLASSIG